jgi:hypothetical protein
MAPSKKHLRWSPRQVVNLSLKNPAYAQWVAKDQAIHGYLLTSLTHEVLTGVATLTISTEVWSTLANMYASRTRARSVQTRIAHGTFKKGTQLVAEYYSKMHDYAGKMATSRHIHGDEEFVSYLLVGLDENFDSVVSAIVARVEPITPTAYLQEGYSIGGWVLLQNVWLCRQDGHI